MVTRLKPTPRLLVREPPANEEVYLTLGLRHPELKRGVAHDQRRSVYDCDWIVDNR